MSTRIVLSVITLLLVTCSRAEDSGDSGKMARVLEELRDRIALDNPVLGGARLLRLRERLPHVPSGSRKRARLLRQIGVEELKSGNNAEAVATLQQAYRLALDLGAAMPPAGLEATLFQLSLAHLRLGEVQNCVLSHTSDSCLFPIEGEGVHRLPMGSTQAVEHLCFCWIGTLATCPRAGSSISPT